MTIYEATDYRSALEVLFESRRQAPESTWTLRRLAEDAHLQPSFVTNVMKGRADFSADQLYLVCKHLQLTEDERSHLLLLLECERSAIPERKKELTGRINRARAQNRKTERHITATVVELAPGEMVEYYLDPFIQLVHVHVAMDRYQREPEKLARALGLSPAHLERCLRTLERIGYIKREARKLRVIAQNRHLPRSNPLCGPHQALMRLKSLDQLGRLDDDNKYSFSVALSGTDETKAKLQDAFLAFLKKAEAIVKPARPEKAFQMNFDLFSWEL